MIRISFETVLFVIGFKDIHKNLIVISLSLYYSIYNIIISYRRTGV